jgi:GDP/GTP exchange factor required for growth at low temperature
LTWEYALEYFLADGLSLQKAYCLNNFNTLVAIVFGLQNELVSKAMRRSWNRVGMWETRVFNDLKVYTSNADDFLYIRRAVDAIADAKPLDVSSRAASIVSAGGTDSKGKAHSDSKLSNPSACIPFIGQSFCSSLSQT